MASRPPRGQCAPLSDGIPNSAGAVTAPCGTRHLIAPVLRSSATISDHGGAIGERYVLVNMKSLGDVRRSGPVRSASFAWLVSRVDSSADTMVDGPVRTAPGSLARQVQSQHRWQRHRPDVELAASGSTATPPQLVPPLCPGV